MPSQDPWKFNDLIFLLSYFATVFLLVPFIAFTVGSYLPDYDSSEYEVALSARNTLQALGACFIVFFLFFNIEVSCLTIYVCIITICICILICLIFLTIMGITMICINYVTVYIVF